jgi:hypothetical protein
VVVVVVVVVLLMEVVVEALAALLGGFAAEHAAVRSARLATTPEQTTLLRLIRQNGPGAIRSAVSTWCVETLGDPGVASACMRPVERRAPSLPQRCDDPRTAGGGRGCERAIPSGGSEKLTITEA